MGDGAAAHGHEDSFTLPLTGLPILIVEDDAASSKLECLLLTDAGARVRIAGSAEDALVVLETFRPHVIVVDLVLPRMGGLLLVERLKENPETSSITIVAVTSLNGPQAERVALGAGCAGYLMKPIDTETFAGEIARKLELPPR